MDASFGHYINYSYVPDTSPNASPCDVLNNSPIDDPEDLLYSFERLLDQNSNFKNFVANRYNDLLNTYWDCNYSIPLLNQMIAEKEAEMPRQLSRWDPTLYYTQNNGTINQWENHVQDIRDFLNDRCEVIDDRLADCLNLGTRYRVSLKTLPANLDCAGIRVNTVNIPNLPMTGDYYDDLPVDLIANNSFNYEFSHWTSSRGTIISNPTNDSIRLTFNRNESLIAHFDYVGAGKKLGSDAINLQGLYFGKGIEERFNSSNIVQPGDFVVLAEDSAMFHAKYGFAADYKFNGKLENNGEKIWLNDICENIIDSLRYDNNLPWDTIPDNGLYSLALIDASADNADPLNWSAQSEYTSPGAENIFCGSITNNQTVIHVSCSNSNDGFILLITGGGTAPYTYSWSNGATGSSIGDLAAGLYTVNITDAFNCTLTEVIEITAPPELQANITSIDESFYQANDGSAAANPTGGTAPYTYSWSNGASTPSISNLPPNNYTVTVTDVNQCQQTESFIINAMSCSSVLVQTNQPSLNSTIYQVADYIQSNGTVNTNQMVTFKAGDFIELTNDFEVKTGADFYADIDGCN